MGVREKGDCSSSWFCEKWKGILCCVLIKRGLIISVGAWVRWLRTINDVGQFKGVG